jgi:hypothetical protein
MPDYPGLVQSAFVRMEAGGSSPVQLTLTLSTPTPGNILIFLIAGWSGGVHGQTLTPQFTVDSDSPSGDFDEADKAFVAGTTCCWRTVQEGDGVNWSFTVGNTSNPLNFALYEVAPGTVTQIGSSPGAVVNPVPSGDLVDNILYPARTTVFLGFVFGDTYSTLAPSNYTVDQVYQGEETGWFGLFAHGSGAPLWDESGAAELTCSGASLAQGRAVIVLGAGPPVPTVSLESVELCTGATVLQWTSTLGTSATLTAGSGPALPVALNGAQSVSPATTTTYTLSVTGAGGTTTASVSVSPPGVIAPCIRVLFGLKIPSGQGQSVNELDGASSIATLDIEANDPSNELKYLLTKPEVIGRIAVLKMGFEGMNLSDFVPLHTMQISDVGRTSEGWIKFSCRDSLALLDRALWFCGGPQPVALPWLYNQAYTAGQYVQDTNGNIEQCITTGVTDEDSPPIWPGTVEPGWAPNTNYTLGTWITDQNGNLQQLTTVPSGSSSSRPLNTGASGNHAPVWATSLGMTTLDNAGANPDGPLTWTLIAINLLGQQCSDGSVTWQLVAKPYQGVFGGSQAFYVYSLYGQTIQTPEPPLRTAFTSNQYPTLDGNPRYIYGNPIDVLLVALQNELGVGQDPSLPPIVTTDPNDPSNSLVFAPNPAWQQYVPGDDSTLIYPNPFANIDNIKAMRDNQVSGRKFEWAIKRPVTAKSWIQSEILKPLGLYLFVHNDGTLDLKSMGAPATIKPVSIDQHVIDGTPDQQRLAIVNTVTVRCDVNDEGAYSAARVYDAEMSLAQQQSLATYLQEFAHSVESNGLRFAYDSYGVAFSLANRIFNRHGFGTPEYTLKVLLSQLRPELGDFILLSHPLMLDYASRTGKLGITNVLCEIVDRQPDYDAGEITLKVWDTRFMKLSQAYDIAPLASSIPDWTSATPAEKAQYLFICYWPGYYSDGTPGNKIGTCPAGE